MGTSWPFRFTIINDGSYLATPGNAIVSAKEYALSQCPAGNKDEEIDELCQENEQGQGQGLGQGLGHGQRQEHGHRQVNVEEDYLHCLLVKN